VSSLLAACGGFLLAVLWMDLMFDALALRVPRGRPLPVDDLAKIAAYYRRVTTDARPMSLLVAVVMLTTVGGALVQLVRGDAALASRAAALVLCVTPIVLAQRRVFPNAVRLGARTESPVAEDALAREIARAHVACFAAMLGFVALQIASA